MSLKMSSKPWNLIESMADKLAVAGCTNKDGLDLRKDLLDEHSVTETAWRRTTFAYASHVLHGRGHMSVTGLVLHAWWGGGVNKGA